MKIHSRNDLMIQSKMGETSLGQVRSLWKEKNFMALHVSSHCDIIYAVALAWKLYNLFRRCVSVKLMLEHFLSRP